MSYFIFDIDGTIADLTHRLPLIKGETKQWDEFHEACDKDRPIVPVIATLNALIMAHHSPIFITARPESSFEKTAEWIDIHTEAAYPWQSLYMRKDGDRRPDYEIKREIYLSLPIGIRNNVAGVFEDRASVVKMWRELGLRVFQVDDGNY